MHFTYQAWDRWKLVMLHRLRSRHKEYSAELHYHTVIKQKCIKHWITYTQYRVECQQKIGQLDNVEIISCKTIHHAIFLITWRVGRNQCEGSNIIFR